MQIILSIILLVLCNKATACKCSDHQTYLSNGYASCSNHNKAGSRCSFSCHSGYSLEGYSSNDCKRNGEWDGAKPNCRAIARCDSSYISLNNGYASCSDRNIEHSKCKYSCRSGYILVGWTETNCQTNSVWTHAKPYCEVTCDASYTTLSYGTANCRNGNRVGSYCQYSCSYGYVLSGYSYSMCKSNGLWDNNKPTCQVVTCPNSQLYFEDGSVSCTNSVIRGSTCTYNCATGYIISGSSSTYCAYSGSWSNAKPQCLAKCPPPYDVVNGHITCSSSLYEYKTVCAIHCDIGYKLIGNQEIQCTQLAIWTQAGQCRIKKCFSKEPGLNNGKEFCTSGNEFGSICSYTCLDGYFLNGSTMTFCNSNGEWNITKPVCEERNCTDDYLTIENGNVQCFGSIYGNSYNSLCIFDCHDGFKINGTVIAVCNSDRKWSSEKPICEALLCKAPIQLIHGDYSCDKNNFEFGTICELQCHQGYEIVGAFSMTCSAKAEWTIPGKCTAILCPDNYTSISNGIVNCKGADLKNMYGSQCTYHCNSGYYLNGENENTCEKNRMWKTHQPICKERFCSLNFTVIENGLAECNGAEKNSYNSTCIYRCNEGFELFGQRSLTCNADEQWSGQLPKCKAINCKAPDFLEGGKFICNRTSFEYLSTCELSCYEGYRTIGFTEISCQSNKTWSQRGHCLDIEIPRFKYNCSDLTIKAAKLGISTRVKYEIPEIFDNSNKTIKGIGNPESESVFEVGSTNVIITAMDHAGNKATCNFSVTVQRAYCEPPDIDTSGQDLIDYICLDQYIYGASCELKCKNERTVSGADTLTCIKDAELENYRWTYSGAVSPKCHSFGCASLKPPANGAMICENEFCFTLCRENYTLSKAGSHNYRCDTTKGMWVPKNLISTCYPATRPKGVQYKPKFYFFAGDCDKDRMDIKEKFQRCVQNTSFNEVCSFNGGCNIDNVKLECGNKIGRPKRELHSLYYVITPAIDLGHFHDSKNANETREYYSQLSLALAEYLMKSIEKEIHNVGMFDEMDKGSVEFICDSGKEFITETISCVVCGQGYYFNNDTGLCKICPHNTYQENETSFVCKHCFNDTTTLHEGSVSVDECKNYCNEGEFSPNGQEPCEKCPVGTYQADRGRTKCTQCPFGMSTLNTGMTSKHTCLFHDVKAGNNEPGPVVLVYDYNEIAFTFMTWINGLSVIPERDETESAGIFIDKVTIQLFRTNTSDWNHLALVYETGRSEIYWNGKLINELTNYTIFLFEDEAVQFKVYNEMEITLNGVQLTTSLLTESDIQDFFNNCQQNVDFNRLAVNPFKKSPQLKYSTCTEKCKAGHFSTTGYGPCKVCPVGSYQPKEGMKLCHWCPFSMASIDERSSDLGCTFFDIRWTGENVGPLVNIIDPFPKTFSFMMRFLESASIKFSLGQVRDASQHAYLAIDTIALIIQSENNNNTGPKTKWSHLALVYREGFSTLYINGLVSESRSGLFVSHLSNKRIIFVGVENLTYILASEVQLTESYYSKEQVLEFATGCFTEVNNNVLYVDSVQVELLSPSSCAEVIEKDEANIVTATDVSLDVKSQTPIIEDYITDVVSWEHRIEGDGFELENKSNDLQDANNVWVVTVLTGSLPLSQNSYELTTSNTDRASPINYFEQLGADISQGSAHNEPNGIGVVPTSREAESSNSDKTTEQADVLPRSTDIVLSIHDLATGVTDLSTVSNEVASTLSSVVSRNTDENQDVTVTQPGKNVIEPSNIDIEPSDTYIQSINIDIQPSKIDIESSKFGIASSYTDIEPSNTDRESSIVYLETIKIDIEQSYIDIKSGITDSEQNKTVIESSNTDINPTNTDIEPTQTNIEPSYSDMEPSNATIEPRFAVIESVVSDTESKYIEKVLNYSKITQVSNDKSLNSNTIESSITEPEPVFTVKVPNITDTTPSGTDIAAVEIEP